MNPPANKILASSAASAFKSGRPEASWCIFGSFGSRSRISKAGISISTAKPNIIP
jgi:hypothetical protein